MSVANIPTPNSTFVRYGVTPDNTTVRASTPSGQATTLPPISPVPQWEAPNGFHNLPPELSTPKTAGLFSSDPAIQAALNDPNMDFETLIELQIALNNKLMDTMTASKLKDVEANQKTSEKNQAERVQQIKDSQVKLESAAKKSWWSTTMNIVAKVATVIAAVAMIAGAVLAAPFTGGVSVGLVVVGVYMLATAAYDLANEINVAVNGDDARWPAVSVGAGIAKLMTWINEKIVNLLENTGVINADSAEVLNKFIKDAEPWIAMAMDLAVSVAIMFVPGAQLVAGPQIIKGFATIVSAIAQATKAGLDISKAFDMKALAAITAKLDTLQAQIDDLTQSNKQLMEILKIINETKADSEDTLTKVFENQASNSRAIFSMA